MLISILLLSTNSHSHKTHHLLCKRNDNIHRVIQVFSLRGQVESPRVWSQTGPLSRLDPVDLNNAGPRNLSIPRPGFAVWASFVRFPACDREWGVSLDPSGANEGPNTEKKDAVERRKIGRPKSNGVKPKQKLSGPKAAVMHLAPLLATLPSSPHDRRSLTQRRGGGERTHSGRDSDRCGGGGERAPKSQHRFW